MAHCGAMASLAETGARARPRASCGASSSRARGASVRPRALRSQRAPSSSKDESFAEQVSGVVTELLVRAPCQLLVDRVLAPLYAGKGDDDCGSGRYRDPATGLCVMMCKEGYVWDAREKSCKLLVANPGGEPSVVSEHVPAIGRKPPGGKDLRPPEAPRPLPDALERRYYGHEDASPADALIRFLLNNVILRGSGAADSCAVGYFYDKKAKRCSPICKPGFVYDPTTKRCVRAEVALRG